MIGNKQDFVISKQAVFQAACLSSGGGIQPVYFSIYLFSPNIKVFQTQKCSGIVDI
jgi:hypothetical protein